MKILVTGGAGFIGSAFCRMMAARGGHRIVVLDKLTYAGSPASLIALTARPGFRLVEGDICDRALVARLLESEDIDWIVNFAAETHVDRSIEGPRAFVETNIVGTFALLDAALGYWRTLAPARRDSFRFHHVSTDEVYGDLGADDPAFSETTAYAPSSPYSASKAASDHLVRAWHRTYGLPVTISNCSNNYGPFHFPEKLIPLTILNALEERPISVYGTGGNVRDWLYVEDHVAAIAQVLEAGRVGETYAVGGQAECTNLALVEKVCGLLDAWRPRRTGAPHSALITFVADRPGHDRRYAIDIGKISRELGWRPRHSLEAGLALTVDWYLANGWWWRPIRHAVYGGQRLGALESA